MKIFFLLFIASFSSFAQQPTKEQIRQVEINRKLVRNMKGQPFPVFDLTAIDGKRYTSENTKGKYILFNFWFTRCRPCVEEMPELNEMIKEFENREVLFLAPTFDDSLAVKKFIDRFDFNYELISDERDFCRELNVSSFPTHFIINRDGIVEKVVIGYSELTVGTLRKSLNKLLSSE